VDSPADTLHLSARSRSPAREAGSTVGRYVVKRVVGEGGMGRVYEARDPQLDRAVALKLLHGSNPLYRARLLREAQAMARLEHENVVHVYDAGVDGDQAWVAMELIHGTTVAEWLKQAPRGWREVVRVFRAAGRGLAAAHAAELVHRDVKPTNLLVDEAGRVKVSDFGLVTTEDERATPTEEPPRVDEDSLAKSGALATPLTQVGSIVGTPAFMAPEQLRGERADARSDQFSFCVSLYWALYGRLPFGVRTAGPTPPVPPPPAGNPAPRFLHQVIVRGLADQPDARFPSLNALLAELDRDPARSRNRRLGALGAVAALSGVYFLARTQHDRAPVCAGSDAQLAGVWDGARREAVRRAFDGSGVPYAAAAFDGAARQLDGYAAGWVRQHGEACEATRVRHEQSEELYDLRMACLSQRRAELAQLTELLSRADGKLVERASSSVEALTGLGSCANVAELKAPLPPPEDARARAEARRLSDELGRARAFVAAGRYSDGLAGAQAAADGARALGWPPLQAEALYDVGYAQGRAGDAKHAVPSLESALVAAERGRNDRIAARSCAALVQIVGDEEGRLEPALAWSRHAFAWLDRMGGDDEILLKLRVNLGGIEEAQGRLDDARAEYEAALALAEKRAGSAVAAKPLGGLGLVAQDQERVEEAIAYQRRALALQEKLLGPDHPDVGVTLNNLAYSLVDGDQLDEAQRVLVRARALFEAALGPTHEFVAATVMSLGDVALRAGRLDEALALTLRAQSMREQRYGASHPYLAEVMVQLGFVRGARGEWGEALALHRRAVALAEPSLGKEHPTVAAGLCGEGAALVALHRPAEAIAPLERALALPLASRYRRGQAKEALARARAEARR